MVLLLAWSTVAAAQNVSPLTVRARLLRIEDTRRDEPAFIDSLLDGKDPDARAWSALTAGRIGARSHLAALRRAAVSADTQPAANALFALGLLKDTSAISIAVEALRAVPAVSIEAAWLLGELGAAGRGAIVAAIGDTTLTAPTRGALLLAGARLRPVPTAAVLPWLASADSALAWRAAYVLARGRSASGVRAMLAQSTSPWGAVREQVARGAAKTITGDSLAGMATAALASLVKDTSARVRVNAVRSAASFGALFRDVVLAALTDPDAGVALTAAESLGDVLGDDIADWTRAFDAQKSFAIQKAIVSAGIRKGKRLDEYGGWAQSRDWRRRASAAEYLMKGSRVLVFREFVRVQRDADGRVRAAATGALAAFVDTVALRDSIRALLRGRLLDKDVQVRAQALRGLRRGATAQDLSAALASYRMSLRDGDNDARLAFWQFADSAMAGSAIAIPDATERMLAGLKRPSDPLERQAASRIARYASWKDSTGTARPLPWYEARAREAMLASPILRIETERGVMELRLFSRDAPLTVFNISSLARRNYFNGQQFHRVVPNFVVQAGDPRGDGSGGPGYAIRDEINRRRYGRGTLGMALSGPNTGGSQFFVTHAPQPHLDGGYTVFGELVRGGDVLDRITQGDRIVRISVR